MLVMGAGLHPGSHVARSLLSQCDFMERLDGKEKWSNGQYAGTRTCKRWFRAKPCLSSTWMWACGTWPSTMMAKTKMVSFNTVVLGRYGISEVLCHQRKHGSV